MTQTLSIEVPETFAEAWRKLAPEQQSSVIEYTGHLAALEQRREEAEDEAAWEQRFADPAARERFLAWGKKALAGPGDEPLDLRKL